MSFFRRRLIVLFCLVLFITQTREVNKKNKRIKGNKENNQNSLGVEEIHCISDHCYGESTHSTTPVIWSKETGDPKQLFGFGRDCKNCDPMGQGPGTPPGWNKGSNDSSDLSFTDEFRDPEISLNKSGEYKFSAQGEGRVLLPPTIDNKKLSNYCFNIILSEPHVPPVPKISSCSNGVSINNHDEFYLNSTTFRQFTLEWNCGSENCDQTTLMKVSDLFDKQPTALHPVLDTYFRTNKTETELTWKIVKNNNHNYHIAMMITLCPECLARFELLNYKNRPLKHKDFKSNRPDSNKRWHYLKVKMNLKNLKPDGQYFKLKMSTRKEGNSSESGYWAVSPRFRRCKPVGTDSCLKQEGKVCNFGCDSLCEGMRICSTAADCTCVRGFSGPNCDTPCDWDSYGRDCSKRCATICGNWSCNAADGTCSKTQCQRYFVPPDCKTKLEKLDIECVKEAAFKIKEYSTLKEKKLKYELQEEGGKWEEIFPNENDTSSAWNFAGVSINLTKGKSYKIRTRANNITSPEFEFKTDCWEPSVPIIRSIAPLNSTHQMLFWKRPTYFWEWNKALEIHIYLLGPGLRRNTKLDEQTSQAFGRERQFRHYLSLRNTSINYRLRIRAIDENYSQFPKIVEMWYLTPDLIRTAIVREEQHNSTMKIIDVDLKRIDNETDCGFVYVAMKNSSTCPTLKSNEILSQRNNSEVWPAGEFPVCQLQLNQIYEFMVSVEDSGSWLLTSILTIFFLTVCIALFSGYRWIHQRHSQISQSTSLSTVSNVPVDESSALPLHNCKSSDIKKLKKFEDYVQRAAENGVLQQQFNKLPRGLVRPCEFGKLPRNKAKNRYVNLIAYDETRVPLLRSLPGGRSGYINANYIPGYSKEKAYIATQGPLPNTIVDFWKMIWQEEVQVICMLVDLFEGGVSMCERYWPDEGVETQYGDLTVLTLKQNVFADYTYRTFLLRHLGKTKSETIEHLQFTGWPQKGVPMYSHSVVEYVNKILSLQPGQGPIVVHCSGNTGRTGTIILCDITLRHLAAEETVDVFTEAKKMYCARANMLNDMKEYVLAHLVPTQCLFPSPTKILCSEFTKQKIEEMKKGLPGYIARLEDTSWMDKALRPLEPLRPPHPENVAKNRFRMLTPVGPSLVTLTKYPTYDENSGYISAVSVDGAKIRKQYLASQLPMPSTRTDFWRLIIEENIELIIILQQPDPDDETCCDIIPRGTTLIPMPHLEVVTTTSAMCSEYFTTDKLLLSDTSVSPKRRTNITALTLNNWTPGVDARPPDPEALVELWRVSEKIQRPHGRTLVLCYDGVTGCGLYLALSFMLDRMGADQECDVILAVRAIRRSRREFVGSQWQFEYLYDAAEKYFNSFKHYDNFTRDLKSRQHDA